MALEEGTEVRASDGSAVGRITRVVADHQKDIFSGLAFRAGVLGSEQFAPADTVAAITTEAVELTLTADEVGSLESYSG